MPSDKVLKRKEAEVTALKEKLDAAIAGVVVDYKGINVADDTKLRQDLRGSNIDYFVVKNTVLRRAVAGTNYEDMTPVLKGATALALSNEDPVAGAKILSEFSKTKKEFFDIKSGFVDGGVISADKVNYLGSLPSKEELIAKMLAGFNAPLSGFAHVLTANLRGLVVALNAIREKQA